MLHARASRALVLASLVLWVAYTGSAREGGGGFDPIGALWRTLEGCFAALQSLFLIIIPFTLILLFWKGFIKLIKA